jgi:hypothetical protein
MQHPRADQAAGRFGQMSLVSARRLKPICYRINSNPPNTCLV